MSKEYDGYLANHRKGVLDSYLWLEKNLPDLFKDTDIAKTIYRNVTDHDQTKDGFGSEEYKAYDQWFYGVRTPAAKYNFNRAWLHHIHMNPHHWQYWILIGDDDGITPLMMPYQYIIEMICDWWSFSINKGNPYEIFDFYNENKGKMILSPFTRKAVENILDQMLEKMHELDGVI